MNVFAYTHNNPINYIDPDGEFAVVGALLGGASGFVSDVALQAAGNLARGEKAFSNINYAEAFVSAGFGVASGALGVGVLTQSSKALKSFTVFSKLAKNVRARELAKLAGKHRNVEITAHRIAQRNKEFKAMMEAIGKGSIFPVTKAIVKEVMFDDNDDAIQKSEGK